MRRVLGTPDVRNSSKKKNVLLTRNYYSLISNVKLKNSYATDKKPLNLASDLATFWLSSRVHAISGSGLLRGLKDEIWENGV